ncbi:MAG: alpha/beta fold hydrolase [Pseudomonadota bacterium]
MVDQKPTLVLLPGLMCGPEIFADIAAALSNEYKNVFGDMTSADTVDGLARNILGSIDAERFSLAGFSMGGIVAMAMVREAPHRIARLALLNTNHRVDPPATRERRNKHMEVVRNGGLSELMQTDLKVAYFHTSDEHTEEARQLVVDMAEKLGPDVFVQQSTALLNRTSTVEALRQFQSPTLVFAAAEDALCKLEWHEDMAALLPNVTLKVLEGAGHMAMLECAGDYTEIVRAWFAAPHTNFENEVSNDVHA